ncbi:a6cd479d-e2f5-4f4e-8e83-652d36405402 [Thermothielavioides terrestris]|uniref:A6cd479d-e2f5-4f4e-8e83-652d36405402 n=1 Tax=Thermothielavioides terrestris TaxID=2587410 RepID=A0A446BGX4_9PEZI|nr:a6cd479d-e2f5-4f4e-8e83-652d36405402 [Thermothielavioides terrestris]
MWELELDPELIPTLKLVFHSAQILFAFISWCLEIAVFRADGSQIVGNNGWTFAVFFLSVPAWIYLTMAPRFPRTRHIANPNAMLAVDALYTVIWLSAFATQAAYNTANLCGSACGVSKAVVGLAFFVFIWTLRYYRWNNRLPGYDRAQLNSQNIDPDKAAFSLAPHDEEAYAPVNTNDNDEQHHGSHYGGDGAHSDYSDHFAGSASHVSGGASTVSAYQDNPFREHEHEHAANPFESDTEYHSGRVSAAGSRYTPPTAADTYEDDSRPVRFPAANYDRIEG